MKGKRIAVLEARLGKQLADLVTQKGGVPLHAPALAEQPDLDPPAIAELVRSLEARGATLAIFQTGVGTRALFGATDGLGLTARFLAQLEKATVVARGPKPTGALRARGVRIDRSAAEPFTTREVLAAIGDAALAGRRVIVQRHGVANAELDQALAARGAEVGPAPGGGGGGVGGIPAHPWSLPGDTGAVRGVISALERHEIGAAVVTNAEEARNLFAVAREVGKGDELRAALNATLVAA